MAISLATKRPARGLGPIVFAVGVSLAVTGCSSPGAGSSSGAGGGLPSAANGTDLAACAHLPCEVQVWPSAQIPIPTSTRVRSLSVTKVGSDSVTLKGSDIGNESNGYCSGNCNSTENNGAFQIVVGSGGGGSENGLGFALVGVDANRAVLRFTVAQG